MRLLRKRLRPDNIPNERRVARGAVGRIVYLALLAVFSVAVLNYLFGDLILLRADGLVLRDENVVATTYIARVDRIDIQQGATIKKGGPLLKLQSLEILERLADLSIKRAELVARATELKIRGETVEQLLPLAERHELEAARVIKQFDGITDSGFITSVRWEQALRANYDALLDRVKLSAESHVLNEEMKALQVALNDADTALTDLKTHYADGEVLAPVSGSVGVAVPYVGNVYRPGDPILSIYSGDPHVLVYMPRRYLFPIYVGMPLQVTDGQHTESGVIAQILPVTATLPKEFQNTFQPSDRNQLARVMLAKGSTFPLNQKVNVSRPYF
jgi:multidrug resistance efflux pump